MMSDEKIKSILRGLIYSIQDDKVEYSELEKRLAKELIEEYKKRTSPDFSLTDLVF